MTIDVHTMTGAYAVDALPADERAFFERHLSVCDACRNEVVSLTATAAALGAAAAEPPPPGLRVRVLADVAHSGQQPPTSGAPRPLRQWPRLHPLLLPAAAALLAFVVVLGGMTGVLLGRVNGLEEQLADSERLAVVLSDPGLQVVSVDAPAGTLARLLHAPGERQAVLVVEGLTPVTSEQTYQLWVLRDGTPVPDRLFLPDEHGRAVVGFEHPVTGEDGVAATVEPGGGSALPTGDVVLHGALDA